MKLSTNDLNTGKKRTWDPYKSKLGAAVMKGLKVDDIIKPGTLVLYLGASTGSTPSHVSDLIGKHGFMYAVEFADRVYISLEKLAKERLNIMPLLIDARKPEEYQFVEKVDLVFVDISQPDEVEIAIRNADMFLKKGGTMMIAVKSQSIDVTKDPNKVYKESKQQLQKAGYDVKNVVDIDRYEKKHGFILATK
ncbi:fibrillarin [archaeon]|nr:fibrillarin [archaeon]